MIYKRFAIFLCLLVGYILSPHNAAAESTSLFRDSLFATQRGALLQARHQPQTGEVAMQASSLFIGRQGSSLFAEPIVPEQPQPVAYRLRDQSAVARIRNLIGHAESRRHGYDAIQHGADRLPAKSPTNLTIAEIYTWIAATPGQHHAIGRYQFIPATLRRLVNELQVDPQTRFSPEIQDQLADELLAEAGLQAFNRGDISRHQFMNNLAKIWAGLPNSSGRSHYHGYAGNRATMTWAYFDSEMSDIFPG